MKEIQRQNKMKLYLTYDYDNVTSVWDSKKKAKKALKKLEKNGEGPIGLYIEAVKLNSTIEG